MIVSCPNCKTKYRVSDEAIRPEGTKLKCTKCGHIFVYKKDQSIDNIDTSKKIYLEKPVADKKKLGLIVGIICGFILMGVAGWYLYPMVSKYFPKKEKKINQTTAASNGTSLDAIKKIALEDVKQYFVKNDIVGKLLVIQGKAVNHFNKPKALIKIEATLYDDKGNVLEKKDILCGNTLSLFQLQSWPKKRLEDELNSKVGILMKNTNIPPGGSVDFMVIFYNPPPNMSEYGVKVIQAEDIPEKDKK